MTPRWSIRAVAAALLLTVYVGGGGGLASIDLLFHSDLDANDLFGRRHVESADGPGCHAERCTLARTAVDAPLVSGLTGSFRAITPPSGLSLLTPAQEAHRQAPRGLSLPRSPPR